MSAPPTLDLHRPWPKDTHFEIRMVEWTEEFKAGEFIIEDSTAFTQEVLVTETRSDEMDILYSIENPLMAYSSNWNLDGQNQKMLADKITIPCSYSAATGQLHIKDWEKLSAATKLKYEKLLDVLKSEDGAMSSYFDLIFDEYFRALETEEGIKSIYAKDLDFILKPYAKSYERAVPKIITTNTKSPFNPKDSLQSTETFTYIGLGIEAKPTIEYLIDFDMAPLMAIMRDMFEKLNNAFSNNDELAEKKRKEFDSINMEMTNLTTYTIDPSTTQPSEITFIAEIKGFDGRKTMHSIHHKTITIVNQ